MKKIAVVCCYYGELPAYFSLFLRSLRQNPFVTLFLVTDGERAFPDLPENLRVVNLSFPALREKIQSLYPFRVCLPHPYKLCDYKFAYGEIFADLLDGYDYVGWCDVDVIWGDFAAFLTEEALSCDIVGGLGHFTLLKNTPAMRTLYRESAAYTNLAVPYQKVFRTKESCFFDELYGLNRLSAGKTVFPLLSSVADVKPDKREFFTFHCEEEGSYRLRYDGKKLFQIFSDGREKEVMYVHLQKRKMTVDAGAAEGKVFFIAPDLFSPDGREGGETADYEANGRKLVLAYARAERIQKRAVLRKRIQRKCRNLFGKK